MSTVLYPKVQETLSFILNQWFKELSKSLTLSMDKRILEKYKHWKEIVPDEYKHEITEETISGKFKHIKWEKIPMKTYKKFLYTLDTIPGGIYVDIYKNIISEIGKKDTLNAAKEFVQNNLVKINNCRELYIQMWNRVENRDEENMLEQTRKILLDVALVDRPKPLEIWELRREVSPRIITFPMLMSWSDMYSFYKRNVNKEKVEIDVAENFVHKQSDSEMKNVDEKYNFNIMNMQEKYFNNSPWKSVNKLNDYAKRRHWDDLRTETVRFEHLGIDSFDMKKQRKLMRHFYGPRGSLVIDYLESGKFKYLLAINMNTRKAYFAIPDEIYRYGHNWKIKIKDVKWEPSAKSAINSIKYLQQQTLVKHLFMDQQAAFLSDEFKKYCADNDIQTNYVVKNNVRDIIETQENSRSIHNTTSMVDRLIRTLRLMNYNLGNTKVITPPLLNYLIDEYNRSPHSTLSKIFKKPTCPNDVDGNIYAETEIAKYFARENFLLTCNNERIIGSTCRVMNQAHYMDKVKPKLLPGTFKIVGKKRELFKLKQNNNTIMVPRWMIKLD